MTVYIVGVRAECKTTDGFRYACHTKVFPYLFKDKSVLQQYLLRLISDAAQRDGREINPDTLVYEKMTPIRGLEREGNVEFI